MEMKHALTTLIIFLKCFLFGNIIYGQMTLTKYDFPFQVNEKTVTVLVIKSKHGGIPTLLTLNDNIVYKGVFEILKQDSTIEDSESLIPGVQTSLNWYTDFNKDHKNVSLKDSLLVTDYFDNGIIDHSEIFSGEGCHDCGVVSVTVYKQLYFNKKLKKARNDFFLGNYSSWR